jgi:hypothetical protein
MDYQKIYDQIIGRAQNRILEGYKEKHHVIPKCLGGSDGKENIIELTAREHFLCHKLLVKIHPFNPRLLYALWLMTIGKKKPKNTDAYKVTSREYEELKIKFISKKTGSKITQYSKNKIGKSNSKIVIQYDLNGNFIKEYSSAMNAEREITNNLEAHWKQVNNNINDCCRLRQKSAYGFIWKYKGDILNLEQHKGSLNKKNGNKGN